MANMAVNRWWISVTNRDSQAVFLAVCLIKRKNWKFHFRILGLLILAVVNACFAVSVPRMRDVYMLAIGTDTVNLYLLFVVLDLIFIVCCIIYLSSHLLEVWKEKTPENKYQNLNLFFFGQIISKLNSTTKTMTLICITLIFAIFLFVAAPVLIGWSEGYLEIRSIYDIQIYSRYNKVYEETDSSKRWKICLMDRL